jgi:hypothetical protein
MSKVEINPPGDIGLGLFVIAYLPAVTVVLTLLGIRVYVEVYPSGTGLGTLASKVPKSPLVIRF